MRKLLPLLFAAATLASCGGEKTGEMTSNHDSLTNQSIKTSEVYEETVSYPAGNVTSKSFIVWDKSAASPRPVILIVPEWWGLTDYPKTRARELAKMGFLAMAVDMYGDGKTADNPEAAGMLATPFYSDTALVRSRLTAALDKVKSMPEADGSKVVLMGYCFGGAMSLMGAKLGLPLRGAVSFHGNLKGTASKTVPVLVCHGEADGMVPPAEVDAWRKSMDSLGADYTFKSYPGATHAFTNPEATAKGEKFKIPIAYNKAADSASWVDFQAFLKKVL